MNSFNTDNDTEQIIRKYKGLQVEIYTFNQSCFPRVSKESLLPIAKTCDIEGNIEALVYYLKNYFIWKQTVIFILYYRWYPPGHGDFYDSFKNSGLLQKFINSVS